MGSLPMAASLSIPPDWLSFLRPEKLQRKVGVEEVTAADLGVMATGLCMGNAERRIHIALKGVATIHECTYMHAEEQT